MSHGSTIVVGAGLSGLACAFDLARAGRDVVVLEAASRAGGVVGTVERGGFRFETGPTAAQASAASFRTLCGELGIADRLVASPREQRDRFVFVRGRLRALPTSPVEFLESSLLSLRARFHVGSEALRKWKPPSDGSEPDLETLLTERLGAEAARVLGGSFVRGIYACEMSELGARSAMPRLWRMLEEHGSFISAMKSMGSKPALDLPGPSVSRTSLLSFANGLQEIVDALGRELGSRVHTGCAAARIERMRATPHEGVRDATAERGRVRTDETIRSGTGEKARVAGDERIVDSDARAWRVVAEDGRSFEAEHLVLAIPAASAARLLESVSDPTFPLDTLRRITHSRVTLVHLGFDEGELRELPAGFGYLVPPPDTRGAGGTEDRNERRSSARAADSEEPLVLGTIFVSNLFAGRAPPGSTAVSSFYKSGDVELMNDSDLIAQAGRDLALALRRDEPLRARVEYIQRWGDVIPRYAVGHAERVRALLERVDGDLPGLHLAGSYVAGVSVDDVIARGRAVAAEILGTSSGSSSSESSAESTTESGSSSNSNLGDAPRKSAS